MTDDFTLNIQYKGIERAFTARLMLHGYTHRIQVQIDHTNVWFEPDEEGAYRAVPVPGEDDNEMKRIDPGLLALLSQHITEILA